MAIKGEESWRVLRTSLLSGTQDSFENSKKQDLTPKYGLNKKRGLSLILIVALKPKLMRGGLIDKPSPSTIRPINTYILRLISRLMKLIDSTLIEHKIQRFLYAGYSYRVGKSAIPTTNSSIVSLQFNEHQ